MTIITLPTAADVKADSITCTSEQGTTIGGSLHYHGNCQSEDGTTVAAGGVSTDSRACGVYGIQGPNDNSAYKGGCVSK